MLIVDTVHETVGEADAADALSATRHYHAFHWSGLTFPVKKDRRNAALFTPPLKSVEWLRKPLELHRGLFTSVRQCLAWLELQIDAFRPRTLGEKETALKRAQGTLLDGRSYNVTYESATGTFVALGVVVCPRVDYDCPVHRYNPRGAHE